MKRLLLILLTASIAVLSTSCNGKNDLQPGTNPDDPLSEDFSFDPENMFLTISPDPVHVELRGTVQVKAVVINRDHETVINPFIQWKVKDGKMASVTNTGEVTGVVLGETTLIATYLKDTDVKAEVPLFIEPPLESLKFTKTRINTRVEGEQIELSGFLETVPEDAYRGNIQWSVGDKNIATVDESGVVTFLKRGGTPVSAVAVNSKGVTISKDEISVNLLRPVPPGYVDLGLTSGTLWAEDDDPQWCFWEEAKAKYLGGNTPNGETIPTEDDWRELILEAQYKPYYILDFRPLMTQEEIDDIIAESGSEESIVWCTEMSIDQSNYYWTLYIVGPNGNTLRIQHRPIFRVDWNCTWDEYNDSGNETSDMVRRHSARYVNPELYINLDLKYSKKTRTEPDANGWYYMYDLIWHYTGESEINVPHAEAKYVRAGAYKMWVRPVIKD